MVERIRSISEKGKEILLVDMTGCPPSEVAHVARTVPNHVSIRPRGSVLLLVNFTGASFDREAIRAIKETAVFDKPYIKKAAWIGTSYMQGESYAEIQEFSRRKFSAFSNLQQAITWLVKD
jgi:hypothetical protein